MDKMLGKFTLLSLFTPCAMAAVNCHQKKGQDLAMNATEMQFICGKGKQSFIAICDVTTDPIEAGKGWLDIKEAHWTRHGNNQGIEGKFGFISCSRK